MSETNKTPTEQKEVISQIPNEEIKLSDIVQYVGNALEQAKVYNLEAEVIASAFDALIENPQLSIVECLDHGLNEWIK